MGPALAILAFSLVAAAAAPARAPPPPSVPVDAWIAWRDAFVKDDGRLVDVDNGGVSHSEGQGYALLLAAFARDPDTFRKVWGWTKANLMVRADGLAAWRWVPKDDPHVKDRNDATDGDLLIAWGLAEGARRFERPEYRAASRRIARALLAHATFETPLGLMLKPGVAGFGPKDSKDGPLVNPSYWVFPAFDALAKIAPSPAWAKLRAGGYALLAAARFGKAGLPTDWVSVKEKAPAPAAGRPPLFSYDAIRVPLYLAWDASAPKAAFEPYARAFGSDDAPAIVDATGAKPDVPFGDPGYRAVAASALCAADGAKIPADLKTVGDARYFPATLHVMSLALWGGRLAACG